MRREAPFSDDRNEDIEESCYSAGYVDPVAIIAKAVVHRVLQDSHVEDALSNSDSVLLLTVRQKGWIEPIKHAWLDTTKSFADKAYRFQEQSAKGKPLIGIATITEKLDGEDYQLRDVRNAMARCAVAGRLCLLFSLWPKSEYVPEEIAALVDCEISVQPTYPHIAAVYREMGGKAISGAFTEEHAAQTTPWAASAAYRAGMSGDRWYERLLKLTTLQTDATARREKAEATRKEESDARIKGRRKVESADLMGVKPLSELHAMGEFSEWGENLRQDLDAFRHHGLPWEALDRGVLLSGPPGVGKTSAVRSLAVSLGVKLIAGSYSIWMGHGDGHQGILLAGMRQSFIAAREAGQPVILFIDEIDAFGCRDKAGHDDQHKHWVAGTVGGLLQEIDGVQGRGKIIVIGATNRPTEIDPAILRSGRLDKHIRISLPNAEGLSAILRAYLGSDCSDADLRKIGFELLGGTGADCEQLVRNARRIARAAQRAMRTEDLQLALYGVDERTPKELFRSAVHESGHAVLTELLQPGAVLAATCRRLAGGFGCVNTAPLPAPCTDEQMRNRIRALLAGRASDIVINKLVDTGSGGSTDSDLACATHLALQYCATYGFAANEAGMRWRGVHRNEDVPTALKDHPEAAVAVEKLLSVEMEQAIASVEIHRPQIVRLALALTKSKTMTGDEVRSVMRESKRNPQKTKAAHESKTTLGNK